MPLLLCLVCIAAKRKLQSPKAAEFEQSLGTPMRTQVLTALVLPHRTNFVYRRTFRWNYTNTPVVQTFRIHIGLAPGDYSIVEDTGTNLSYTFLRTNWGAERMERHFAVVTAQLELGLETRDSNEVHWPDFPPDHFRLSWRGTWPWVNVFSTKDPSMPKTQWPLYALVIGTNYIEGLLEDRRFFMIDRLDTLSLTVFNPNP
jgi:hypothetical protein